MSKLLIDESPLTFQPSLAYAIGLNEAIVLQQIHYWISNQKNKGYEQDGYKWVYNTYAEWKENNFPFWSEATIQRVFASLEEKGLVISIQPMKGKYDRTKYYRIDHSKLDTFDDSKLLCSLNESETTAEKTTPFFTDEERAQNEAKMQAILEAERKAAEANKKGAAWRGRELLPPQYLEYGDWWHAQTGLQMYGAKAKAKMDASWNKAFKAWWENELTTADLKAALDGNKWRSISDPNQLTKDAAAIHALPKANTEPAVKPHKVYDPTAEEKKEYVPAPENLKRRHVTE